MGDLIKVDFKKSKKPATQSIRERVYSTIESFYGVPMTDENYDRLLHDEKSFEELLKILHIDSLLSSPIANDAVIDLAKDIFTIRTMFRQLKYQCMVATNKTDAFADAKLSDKIIKEWTESK